MHSVSAGLPQAVPAGLKPLSVQLPVPLQVSWLTHAVPASPQEVPAGSSLARQVPLPLQVSGLVHSVSAGLPQAVPAGLKPSAGQAALVPVQFSATSQSLAEPRQTVVAEAKVSAGQPLFTPSQLSATSQGPAEARQTAVLFASAGQAALEPVQVSAGSQTPADGRQTVVLDLKPLSTQMPLPSQVSWFSQAPGVPPQAVPLDLGLPLLQHWSVILPWSHLLLGLHVSVVQALPSLQSESIVQEGGSSVNFVCACEPAALAVR